MKGKTHRRYNPLTGQWVLVCPERNKRPWQGEQSNPLPLNHTSYDPHCYLCPGNLRNNGEKNPLYTNTYSFVNDFSALKPIDSPQQEHNGLLKSKSEAGICKVICFSPDHSKTLAFMSVNEIQIVIKQWKTEYAELSQIEWIHYVQIFENKGAMMGCSNPHPHGQIWAQESIPDQVATKGLYQLRYYEQHKRSLLLDYVQQEIESNERIVVQNDHFVALVPYWAVWPFELMILPTFAMSTIKHLSKEQEVSLASSIQKVCICYDNLFKTSFPYSMGMHQAPCDSKEHPEWQWHMIFNPPLLRSASIKKHMVGYEMFAGPQRDLTAEKAAEMLRNVSSTHYST